MITKLVDKWRIEKPKEDGSYLDGYGQASNDAARELEAALPVWTRITDDPETWPEDGQEVLCATWIDGWMMDSATMGQHSCGIADSQYWRPLCDLDYPPEEKK